MNDHGKQSITIAQIGCGYWGPNLVRNFLQFSDLQRLVVCDLDVHRLEKIRQQFPHIYTTQSVEEVLMDDSIDGIVIVTPPASHYSLASAALLAGKHVMVEKPLATTSDEAKQLCYLAREKHKTLMVGHTFLFNDAVIKAKAYIDSGELGEVYYIISERLNLGRVRQDVNAMWNLAPHDISIILYWLDELPSVVSAKGLTFLQEEVEDVVFLDLAFSSGRAAHIHVSWLDPKKTRKITVVGSRKMLVYDDVSIDSKIMIYDKGIDKKRIVRDLPEIESFAQFQLIQRAGDVLIPKIPFSEPLQNECRHFMDCILHGQPPLTGGENGLQVVCVLEEAQKVLNNYRKE